MASIVINGDTSGSVTLQAPAIAGSTTITLPSTSGTLASIASVNNNGVVYANSSGQPTTGTALTFDGTNFATTGTSTATKLIPTGGTATGNGMYLPAANTLAWSTNGTEGMRLDSSQNLGLGVTPSAWRSTEKAMQIGSGALHSYQSAGINVSSNAYINSSNQDIYVVNGFANRYLQAVGTGAHYWYNAPSGTAGNAITFTQAMTLDASGNLLVGTTSSSAGGTTVRTHISADNYSLGISTTGGGGGSLQAIRFVYGTTACGSVNLTSTTTTYATSSDYRLKNTVEPMTGALAKVTALKPVTYKWNADNSDGEGFIAHELAEVCPQAVVGEKDAVDEEGNPKYQGIDTSFLVATLTAAIKELNAKVEAQAAEIEKLKGA